LDLPLAGVELLAYAALHSKTPLCSRRRESEQFSDAEKTRGFRVFLRIFCLCQFRVRLIKD
jgi:hypothetical protein